jgi:hypothetical protein
VDLRNIGNAKVRGRHSYVPNCGMEEEMANCQPLPVRLAKRDINKGAQVTFEYLALVGFK